MTGFNKWVHRFCLLLAGCTLILIFVGGLVTSTDSGLAVPDWPLSYGRLMPPMIGGIFYEHGHRMVATAVGFLTILLAVLLQRTDKRRWVRRLGWSALGLVILQGVLGGVTVLLRLPPAVSIFHACLAQTFFIVVVTLAVLTSRFWQSAPKPRVEPKSVVPLHHMTAALFGLAYAQLILGAIIRHAGWGITAHIANALLIFALSLWAFHRTKSTPLRRGAGVLFSCVSFQILLGLTTYYAIGAEFDVIPEPFYVTAAITAHVALGALVLGLSVVLFLLAFRTRPPQKPNVKTRLSDYLELTKPGITLTAGITALAGFVLGSKGLVDVIRLFHTSIGTLLIAAGAGTLNMVIERDIDARMKRTKRRPLPAGRLLPGEALLVGCVLSATALLYLAWAVNLLTAFLAGLTLSIYLYIYTPLKKITAFCTVIGAVAGALPPVMGWGAATGTIGPASLVLFGILFFWQFPHFLSLAWIYKEDYEQAGLRMIPRLRDHGAATGWSVFGNSLLLLAVSLLPFWIGLTGKVYFVFAFALGLWMASSSFLFLMDRSARRARRIFFASLAYVPVLVAVLVLNKLT